MFGNLPVFDIIECISLGFLGIHVEIQSPG